MAKSLRYLLNMDSKNFKKLYAESAKPSGFENAYGGWFKESIECIIVLDLQKSNYGNYLEMNIKVYVQGMFGNTYSRCKNLVKKDTGDIFKRQPPEFNDVLAFDSPVDDQNRKERLAKLFSEFIVPFTNKALSRQGLKEFANDGLVFLLPTVKAELT